MYHTISISLLVIYSLIGYRIGLQTALTLINHTNQKFHSLPSYYGIFTALGALLPGLLLLATWLTLEYPVIIEIVMAKFPITANPADVNATKLAINDMLNLATGNITSQSTNPVMHQAAAYYTQLLYLSTILLNITLLLVAIGGILLAKSKISPSLTARNWVEAVMRWLMIACSTIAIFTTVGIVLSVVFESTLFFQKISIWDFLFGLKWSPQTAIRADQVGSSGAFGIIPLFAGTMLISLIAMAVAVPIGLLSALYLSEYASHNVRAWAKPILEILAGIPTVVYGFFAVLVIAPALRSLGTHIGLDVAFDSALAAGLVMGIMIIP
ncbi:phosphate ABC transporter permease, partial [Achromatium sp. WMS2]